MKVVAKTTPEKRAEVIANVDALRAAGHSLAKAWEQAGLGNRLNYYEWKRGGRKRKSEKPTKRPYRRQARVQVHGAPAPHIVAQFVLFSDGNIVNLQDLKRAA